MIFQFNKTSLNSFSPDDAQKRYTFRAESILVQKNPSLMTFFFKYKSPVLNKYRIKKLNSLAYGAISALQVKNLKNEATNDSGFVKL